MGGRLVELREVWYRYPGGPWILRSVNTWFGRGITLVAGRTGSGKSTLLRVAARVAKRVYGGELRGTVSWGVDRVVLVPQNYDAFILMPVVREELEYSLEASGLNVHDARREAVRIARELGIEELLDRRVSSLSVGERQRVALASAIALGARVVMLDEPLAFQDPLGREGLMRLLESLGVEGVVIAEHRVERLASLASRILVVEAGVVKEKPKGWQGWEGQLDRGVVEGCMAGCLEG